MKWIIPLTGSAPARIEIDAGLHPPAVLLTIPPGQIGGEARVLSALEITNLGLAALDAGRVVGQLAAKLGARKR